MRTYSILVGKCYRTGSGEVREVSGYFNGELTCTMHSAYENGERKFHTPSLMGEVRS